MAKCLINLFSVEILHKHGPCAYFSFGMMWKKLIINNSKKLRQLGFGNWGDGIN